MRNQPRILIVILNYNGLAHTLEALRHACAQDYPAFEVLVVDNGSTDGSLAQLREAVRPPCRLLEVPGNVGVSEGLNVGLREASRLGFDFAWLLNNDAFPQPQCLSALVCSMHEHPSVMIATPRLLNPDGSEQHAGGRVDWLHCGLDFLFAAELAGPATFGTTWGTWVTGTAMLIRVSAYEAVGGFDRRFFAYYEDIDLSIRVVRRGGDVRAVPEAVCHHLGSATLGGVVSPFCTFISIRNSWLFLCKNIRPGQRLAARVRHHGIYLEWATMVALDGRESHASAMIGGLWASVQGRYGRPGEVTAPRWLTRLLLSYPSLTRRVARLFRSAGYFLAR